MNATELAPQNGTFPQRLALHLLGAHRLSAAGESVMTAASVRQPALDELLPLSDVIRIDNRPDIAPGASGDQTERLPRDLGLGTFVWRPRSRRGQHPARNSLVERKLKASR